MALVTRRTDLPFERDGASRYLPWLIALMVFLAALALAGVFALSGVARSWDKGLTDTFTVQLPAAEDTRTDERRAAAALKLLRGAPGVESAKLVDKADVERLLRPWLGAAASAEGLPLPQIIDVQVNRGQTRGAEAMAEALRAVVPGATVDDHSVWTDGFIRALRSVEALALLVFVLVAAATVATVVFTTRTGLGLHRDVIEVLHLIGARDAYVASQFAARSMTLALRGATVGVAVAVLVLAALGLLVNSLDAGLIPRGSFPTAGWVSVIALLPATALVAWITARVTVMKSLARLV